MLRRHALCFTPHLARLLHKKGDGVLVALLPEHGIEIFFSSHAMEEFFSSLFKAVFIANKFADCYKHLAIYTIIVISARNGK